MKIDTKLSLTGMTRREVLGVMGGGALIALSFGDGGEATANDTITIVGNRSTVNLSENKRINTQNEIASKLDSTLGNRSRPGLRLILP